MGERSKLVKPETLPEEKQDPTTSVQTNVEFRKIGKTYLCDEVSDNSKAKLESQSTP